MNATQDQYDYLMKFVLIGDASVGKSNLLLRYSGREFCLESKPTIGVEFCFKTLKIDDKVVKTQVWDTAGQQRFRAITQAYYKGAAGAILVYDVTRLSTFENIDKWLGELRQHAGTQNTPVILVGNKIDLEDQRVIKTEQGRELANKYGLYFKETSARDEKSVMQTFESFIRQTYRTKKQRNKLQSLRVGKGKVSNAPRCGKQKQVSLVSSIKSLNKDRCCV